MYYREIKFSPVERICCTSVQDGCLTIGNTSDIGVLREALDYERRGMGRSTLMKKLVARINQLERPPRMREVPR
jgi:hypothetical protein